MEKLSRYTLGAKIDILFIDTIEYILLAGYAPKTQTLSILKRASTKLDTLKYFLQKAWEMDLLQSPKYMSIATPIVQTGSQLGAWMKKQAEAPTKK